MAPIKSWLDFTLLDWPGRVAAVVFLPGCNFRCPFCHNHRLLCADDLPEVPLDAVLDACRRRPGWIDGIVVSGGEPTIHPTLPEMLRRIRRAGLGVKLDTNGSRPGVLAALIAEGLVDHVAMDVKAPLRAESYSRLAGIAVDLGEIRASIELIRTSGIEYTFRTTVVPGQLGEEELLEMAGELCGNGGLVLQDFRPDDALDPAWRAFPAAGAAEMERLSGLLARAERTPRAA